MQDYSEEFPEGLVLSLSGNRLIGSTSAGFKKPAFTEPKLPRVAPGFSRGFFSDGHYEDYPITKPAITETAPGAPSPKKDHVRVTFLGGEILDLSFPAPKEPAKKPGMTWGGSGIPIPCA